MTASRVTDSEHRDGTVADPDDPAARFTDPENTGAPIVPQFSVSQGAEAGDSIEETERYLTEMVWSHRNVSY